MGSITRTAKHNTETAVERRTTRMAYEREIDRLRGWFTLLKDHTLDGSILALIDLALDGKKPLSNDFKKDKTHDYDEVQTLWRDTDKI